jgi:hypothetical protein
VLEDTRFKPRFEQDRTARRDVPSKATKSAVHAIESLKVAD